MTWVKRKLFSEHLEAMLLKQDSVRIALWNSRAHLGSLQGQKLCTSAAMLHHIQSSHLRSFNQRSSGGWGQII